MPPMPGANLLTNEADLAGLPPSALAQAKQTAEIDAGHEPVG